MKLLTFSYLVHDIENVLEVDVYNFHYLKNHGLKLIKVQHFQLEFQHQHVQDELHLTIVNFSKRKNEYFNYLNNQLLFHIKIKIHTLFNRCISFNSSQLIKTDDGKSCFKKYSQFLYFPLLNLGEYVNILKIKINIKF